MSYTGSANIKAAAANKFVVNNYTPGDIEPTMNIL